MIESAVQCEAGWSLAPLAILFREAPFRGLFRSCPLEIVLSKSIHGLYILSASVQPSLTVTPFCRQ